MSKLVTKTVCPNCYNYLSLREIATARRGKVATCKCPNCSEVWDMMLFILPSVGTTVDNRRDLLEVKPDTDLLDSDILKRSIK